MKPQNLPTDIIKGLFIGDEETYIFLFREYYVSLCAYSRRYVGRKDIAEETVSDTFLKIWESRKRLKINIVVNGQTQIEVPVTPYFTITEEVFNNTSGVITSSCMVKKIGTFNIQSLTLYVGITNIVDANNNVSTNVIGAAGLVDLGTKKNQSITLSAALAARDYIYTRIGVQTSGVGERLYSPVQKIKLK